MRPAFLVPLAVVLLAGTQARAQSSPPAPPPPSARSPGPQPPPPADGPPLATLTGQLEFVVKAPPRCREEELFRSEVARRMGYDPFHPDTKGVGGGAGGDDGAGGSGALCCCTAPMGSNPMQCHVEGSSAGCPPYTSPVEGACAGPPPGPCDGSVVGSRASGVDGVAVLVPLLALAALGARRRRRARRSGPSVQGGRRAST
jgi:hypothetical protein